MLVKVSKTIGFTAVFLLGVSTVNAQSIFDKVVKKTVEKVVDKKGGNILQDVKKTAEKAVTPKAVLPTTEYTDKYGISGIYYFSRPIIFEGKEVSAVNIEYIVDRFGAYIHYDVDNEDKEKLPILNTNQASRKYNDQCGVYFQDDSGHVFGGELLPVETGLFLSLWGGSRVYIKDYRDNPSLVYEDPNNKILILGKDKNLVTELANDVEKLKAVAEKGAYNRRASADCSTAGKYPFPAPGMKDAKLNTEALAAVKAHAKTAGWSQTIEYVYAKSKDWNIVRNSSGAIVRRTIRMIAVMKNPTGTCQWEEVKVKQEYNGSDYGKTIFDGNTRIIAPVDCKEAMKYK